MTVLHPCLEPCAISNLEDFLTRIGEQHHFTLNDEHEFVLRHMPVSLTGPSSGRQTQQIHPEIRELRRMTQTLPCPVCTGGVEGLRIRGPRARGYKMNINSFRHGTPCRLNPTRVIAVLPIIAGLTSKG